MLRGIYAAGSGLLSQSSVIDTAGNNMANSGTAGFKKQQLAIQSFGDCMTYRVASGETASKIGSLSHGSTIGKAYTSFEQGALDETGRGLDFALAGDGFFTLQLEDGSTAFTRNGHFMINQEGNLTDSTGALVMGESGPINLETANIKVNSKGEILDEEGDAKDTFLISCPEDKTTLVKLSDGIFQNTAEGTTTAFTGEVKQSCLENANVAVTSEMTDMIAASRSFQSCSQILKMMDQILSKTVNEVGRV